MRATIEKQQLHRELGLVERVVERRTTIPVLAYVRMEVADGRVVFTGTDLDVSLRAGCEAEVTEPGVACLPARKLGEIVRALPDGPVIFEGDERHVTIRSGRARFRLAGMEAENFPEVPTFSGEGVVFPAEGLGRAIERVIFATSFEESRYALSGVQMEWWDGGFRLVATDGHRLALVDSAPVGSLARKACLIPRKAMQELLRLIEHAGEGDDVQFAHDANHAYFRVGGRELVSRLLTGQFPNYELVIPKEYAARARVDAGVFREVCRRVATLADERVPGITLSFSGGGVTLQARQGDEEAVEEMLCEYEGEPLVIAFNSEYVLDFLNVVREGMVDIELKDAQSPALWRPSGEQYVYIVMPMRLMGTP
ncbi:DNA polymerase III subunit beta [bacterium HR10]|uniref:Beta sliding clamp n=1 Tax=uncultured Acidobacteriota bacterium TaxID=171953 RepID=H5SEP3_9BACT|nr:DNA polymerase III subunit beta [uncultured Acidobacteriota bacterium]GBC82654.1 DNA polymerase III subunit beta [bacterium HR10]